MQEIHMHRLERNKISTFSNNQQNKMTILGWNCFFFTYRRWPHVYVQVTNGQRGMDVGLHATTSGQRLWPWIL
jgi:hypothetical protein